MRGSRTRGRSTHLEEEAIGLLEVADDVVRERRADVAVDDAMIEREGEQHHVADHDLVVAHDGLRLIWWTPRMATSGKLMMGVAKRPPCLPSDVIVNVEPPRSSGFVLPARASLAEAVDLRAHLEDALPVRVPHDRHDEAGVGRGRDADVEVLAEDELVRGVVDDGS